jgi:hypothetical protein
MFQTKELEREWAARLQRQEKDRVNGGAGTGYWAPSTNAWKGKHLNLKIYKFHALGDYVSTICHYGTTDLYSTQQVSLKLVPCLVQFTISRHQSELEHQMLKACFLRTSG